MRFSRYKSAESGFSLIEVMVVVAIILIISAMAIPNIMSSVYAMRMRSSLTELTGLIEQTRMRAVRDSKNYQVMTTTSQTRLLFFADFNQDGVFNSATDPFAVVMPQGVTVGGVPGSLNGLALPAAGSYVTGLPAFNNRGLPCTFNNKNDCPFITVAGTPSSFVYYLVTDRGTSMAVTTASSGKVKGWIWSGTAFQ